MPTGAKLDAGSWSVTADTTASTCATASGQWILQFPQTGYPDHHPLPKTWWMKRLSDTGGADDDHHDRLYFGGRPSERDMKLMYEAGVDAILSLDTSTTADAMGVMPLPTTAEAAAVAAEAGMLYHTLAAADYTSTAGVDEIAAFMDFALANTGQASSGNGPIYVQDARGFDAVGAVQLFRARRGLINQPSGSTKTAQAIQEASHHGFTLSADVIQAIARETGETYDATTMAGEMSTVAQATANTAMQSYHWLKYLYNIGEVGVFDAGQIQKFHVNALVDANIKVVINMRQGQEVSGAWAAAPQEPVNLLNLGFGGSTKGIEGTGEAAFDSANPGLIIAPDRDPSWICTYPAGIAYTSYSPCVDNTAYKFESKNTLEWGDAVGQNTRDEGVDLEAAGITYMHLPVGGNMDPAIPFNPAAFLRYAPQFIEAINTAQAAGGHVLFHCTIGYRTGAFPTGLLGVITETETTPQLTRTEMNDLMHGWGYDVADESTGHVFEVGTNSMFAGLPDYKFTGSVDWTVGTIDGSISERAGTAATAPSPPPASAASMAMPTVLGLVLAALFG